MNIFLFKVIEVIVFCILALIFDMLDKKFDRKFFEVICSVLSVLAIISFFTIPYFNKAIVKYGEKFLETETIEYQIDNINLFEDSIEYIEGEKLKTKSLGYINEVNIDKSLKYPVFKIIEQETIHRLGIWSTSRHETIYMIDAPEEIYNKGYIYKKDW